MNDSDDFTLLDDSALLSRRAQMRDELEQLQPGSADHDALSALYNKSTEEVNTRAAEAWARARIADR